jgi:hypothetical protein
MFFRLLKASAFFVFVEFSHCSTELGAVSPCHVLFSFYYTRPAGYACRCGQDKGRESVSGLLRSSEATCRHWDHLEIIVWL